MPTVKPKANAAASTKEASAKETAARLRIVESQVPILVKPFTALREKEEGLKTSYKDVMNTVLSVVAKHAFTKAETRTLLKSVIAKVYCEGDESLVTMEGCPTGYPLLSKYTSIAHPKDAKAAKEVRKAIDKNAGFHQIYKCATGSGTAAQAKAQGKHGGAREKQSFDSVEDFQNAISGIVSKYWDGGENLSDKYEGGLSLEEMEEGIAEIVAGYKAKDEDGADADAE